MEPGTVFNGWDNQCRDPADSPGRWGHHQLTLSLLESAQHPRVSREEKSGEEVPQGEPRGTPVDNDLGIGSGYPEKRRSDQIRKSIFVLNTILRALQSSKPCPFVNCPTLPNCPLEVAQAF
jgi:hypothetical protein